MVTVMKIGTNFKNLRMQGSSLLLADTMGETHRHLRQLLSIDRLDNDRLNTRRRAESGGRTGASARASEFLSRTLDYSDWNENKTFKVDHARFVAETLVQCASLARSISRSNSPLFSMRRGRGTIAPTLRYHPAGYAFLLTATDENTARLEKHAPYCAFNPYVVLFLKVRADLLRNTISLPMERDNMERFVSELNGAIETLRSEARSEEFRKGLDRFQRNVRKNYGSVKHYLKSICENRQDYELFDIKLFFPNVGEECPDYAIGTNKDSLHRYRREWFKKVGKIVPKGSLIGHVWSIQYGFKYAWHFRVIVVLKATSDNSPRSWFPGVVQETWANTVNGATFCVQALVAPRPTNNPANRYKSHMTEPNRTLTEIASALTKPDYFARATAAHGTRVLGKGVIRPKKASCQR